MLNILSRDSHAVDNAADRAADTADRAIRATQRATNDALDQISNGVDKIRDAGPSALGRVAAQLEDITRRGVDVARETSADVRHRLSVAGDRTVGYIQDEPVKAMVIAAAAGATVAALLALFAGRSRN